jgi:RNA polymerase subunit RPABC4/transcription elongation factor Spt4
MPSIPADLTAYLSAALFVIGAYIMAIYLGLIVWTFRDIRSRSRDVLAHILAPLLVAIFTLPGLLVYMLLRPKENLAEAYERALAEEAVLQDLEERRTCPGCQHRVEDDFVICPYCHHQLRLRCTSCGRLNDPDWEVCPYCGHVHPTEGAPAEAALSDAEQQAAQEPEEEAALQEASAEPVLETPLAESPDDEAKA